MNCKRCGEQNSEGSKFCQKCGAELEGSSSEGEIYSSSTRKTTGCPYCGEHNQEGVAFCQKCGAKLPDDQGKPAGTSAAEIMAMGADAVKKLPKKTIAVIALVLVLAILCIVFFQSCKGTSRQAPVEGEKATISLFYDGEKTTVAVNNQLTGIQLDGYAYIDKKSFDGTKIAALVSPGTESTELYLITTTEAIKIAEDVTACSISTSGEGVAYIDQDDVLNLFHYSDRSHTKIANDITRPFLELSPDGKTVSYLVNTPSDENADETELFVYTAGKSTSVGKGLSCVGVSNGGSLIYSIDDQAKSLYVSSLGSEKSKLAADVSRSFLMNRDHTELIFGAGSNSYISINGGEKQKISSDSYVYPVNIRDMNGSFSSYSATYMNLDTFTGRLFGNSSGGLLQLFRFDREGNVEKIHSGPLASFTLSKDAGKFYYIKSGTLYRATSEDFANAEKIAEEVEDFKLTSNGETVYYLSEGALRAKTGDGESIKIADDVADYDITNKDVVLFLTDFSETGTLYACSYGKDKEKIAEEVPYLHVTGNAAFYRLRSESSPEAWDVYASDGSASFSLLIQNVRSS